MYVLIDMSEQDLIRLSLFNEVEVYTREFSERNRELLFCIDSFLRETGVQKDVLRGIGVVVGSGSFTSTRIAVTMANTFGYALNIPLLAIKKEELGSLPSLLKRIQAQPVGQYISATYSGEPNVGSQNKEIEK